MPKHATVKCLADASFFLDEYVFTCVNHLLCHTLLNYYTLRLSHRSYIVEHDTK